MSSNKLRLKRFWHRCWHDKQGAPVVTQNPNLPLLVWLVCLPLGLLVYDGPWHVIISSIGTFAISVWAILELFQGVTYFRQLLGLIVLAGVIVRLLAA